MCRAYQHLPFQTVYITQRASTDLQWTLKHVLMPSTANSSLKYKNRHLEKKSLWLLLHRAQRCMKNAVLHSSATHQRRSREIWSISNAGFKNGNSYFGRCAVTYVRPPAVAAGFARKWDKTWKKNRQINFPLFFHTNAFSQELTNWHRACLTLFRWNKAGKNLVADKRRFSNCEFWALSSFLPFENDALLFWMTTCDFSSASAACLLKQCNRVLQMLFNAWHIFQLPEFFHVMRFISKWFHALISIIFASKEIRTSSFLVSWRA